MRRSRFAALFAALVVKRFAALVVERFAALGMKRFAALVVQRFAALVVKRFAALVVQWSSSLYTSKHTYSQAPLLPLSPASASLLLESWPTRRT